MITFQTRILPWGLTRVTSVWHDLISTGKVPWHLWHVQDTACTTDSTTMAHKKCSKKTEKQAKQPKPLWDKGRVQEARDATDTKKFPSISKATHHFEVTYNKLCCRHENLAVSPEEAHEDQQLLTAAQENTLCKWIKFMGSIRQLLSNGGIQAKVGKMSATLQEELKKIGKPKLPGKNGIYGLLHHPDINLKRLSGLNPKRAQKTSIWLWSRIIFRNSASSYRKTTYLGKISTTWMRRGYN